VGGGVSMVDRERWTLTLEAVGNGPPAVVRVRRALKYCWRVLGLRCVGYGPPSPSSVRGAQDVTSEPPGASAGEVDRFQTDQTGDPDARSAPPAGDPHGNAAVPQQHATIPENRPFGENPSGGLGGIVHTSHGVTRPKT
jgi:hypothetical protein